MKKCKVASCDSASRALGLCVKHYCRQKRGASLLDVSTRGKLEARLKKNSAAKDGESGCIEWTGFIGVNGYGTIKVSGKTWLSHRVAYELYNAPIPPGMCVCHECDNRACINPKHLFIGTNADNSADMSAKGRSARGEKQGASKLNECSVIEIRSRIAAGESHSKIANCFGVSRALIGRINRRECWSHLQPEKLGITVLSESELREMINND